MLHDLIYVALFALIGPVFDYVVFWPVHRRLSQADPALARWWTWASAIGNPWMLVACGAAIWIASDRSWASFGFTVPDGWRLWASLALCLLLIGYHAWAIVTLARSSDARASLRRQFGPVVAVLPHTRTELYWFGAMSLTAGFCEEFLFRGYFIWVFLPWLGWWGAAALSLSIFAVAHLYQGWSGVLRTAIAGAIFTLAVALFGSLWPAIALHALVDLDNGIMAWLVLREGSEPESASGLAASPLQARAGADADAGRT